MGNIIVFAVVFVVMYFLMIRPQQKRAQEAREMLNSIEKGTHVVTIGGLHGVVEELTDETVVLDCEGIYLTFERRAIGRIISTPSEVVEKVETEELEEPVTEVTAEDIVSDVE